MPPMHAKRAKVGLREHDGDHYQHLPRTLGSSQPQGSKAERQSNSYTVGEWQCSYYHCMRDAVGDLMGMGPEPQAEEERSGGKLLSLQQ